MEIEVFFLIFTFWCLKIIISLGKMSEVEEHREDEHQHDGPESTYVPPPQKSIGELLAADQEG